MTNISKEPLCIEVTRGEKVESHHLVDVIIMNDKKEIVEAYGDFQGTILPRSAIKMLQAILLIESGAYTSLGLDLRHLAIASSSHYADPIHTELVHSWLLKLNLNEESLRCGPQMPSRNEVRDSLIRQNLTPHRGHNNCSGKHCGILSICVHKNYNIKNYDLITHPVQQDLIKTLSEVYEYDLQKSPYGIDGCGIPTIAVPLFNLNIGHINLLKRESGKMITDAIARYPELISGDGNFGTEVTRISGGKIFAKTGAEGVYCAFSPSHNQYLSLKVRDGTTRASQFATASLLKKFGWLNIEEEKHLTKFLNPKIKNWEGLEVGEIRIQEA